MLRLLRGQCILGRGGVARFLEFNSIDRNTNLTFSSSRPDDRMTYLVLQVVPEIGPGLFNTSLLLDDGLFDDTSQDTECHGDTVVVITVDRGTSAERLVLLSKDDNSVFKLVGLDTELGYFVSLRLPTTSVLHLPS